VMRKRVGILISGRGSNMTALIEAARAPDYPADIVLVISNMPGAEGLQKARAAGVPVSVVPHKGLPREIFDDAIDAALREAGIDIVCEAGFMRIHGESFMRKWQGRILNIHPSLLPAFKGLHVHEQVLAAGATKSGCTVHFMTAELDSGPIVLQAEVPVLPDDTVDMLAARVLVEEHRIYPEALKLVAEGKVRLENGQAIFRA
jgi:phosphoribosylglycinamide formyltransferase 1